MKNLLKSVACLALAVSVIGFGLASPANAFERPGDRDWRMHEYAARHWHYAHRMPPPHVVYAPPAVVYTPPPPPPEAGINLVVPLNFR